MQKPEIGKTYRIEHSRKGSFTGKVTAINGEWIDVEITAGKARNMASEANEVGEVVRLRDSHCAFWDVK